MSDLHLTLGESPSGLIKIDLETLIETRLLVTATSGGGKSGAIFQLCEACVPHVQTLILDPEGEFSPLRARFPFVLVGPEGETPASVRTAKLLAQRLLELGASAIVDLYELPVHQRHEFVREFLDALVDAPKTLWPSSQARGCLVIVDESHIFAPEKGQGESVAAGAMINMASRGRKRGFCLVAATQRLAMLSKTLAANCQNVLVGRTSQIDQARAAETLHISAKAEKDALWRELSRMPVGRFYAYGMAFAAAAPTEFQVRRAKTLPEKKDRMNLQAPPAPAAVQKLLPRLADLPQEAEKKAKTEEELRADLRNAQTRIRELERQQPTQQDEETTRMLKEKLDQIGLEIESVEKRVESIKAKMATARKVAEQLVATLSDDDAEQVLGSFVDSIRKETSAMLPTLTKRPAAPPRSVPASSRVELPTDGTAPTAAQLRILNSIAWFRAIGIPAPQLIPMAFMAGYTVNGHFNNLRGALRSAGLINYLDGQRTELTTEGEKYAVVPDIEPTNKGLQGEVLKRIAVNEAKIIQPLIRVWPKVMDNESLASAAGYTVNGHFNNMRGHLRSLGLIEYVSGGSKAANLLFPED